VTGLLYAFIGFSTSFGIGWLASLGLRGRGDGSLSIWR